MDTTDHPQAALGSGLWSPLRSAPFTALFVGYVISAVGDGMATVGVAWLALQLAHGDHPGLLVGVAIAAYTLPGVLAAFGLGPLLARFDPRMLVLAEGALRGLALGTIAVLDLASDLRPNSYVLLLGVSSLLGLLGLAGDVAAIVELLPRAQHVAGNTLSTIANFAATVAGPALGGLVIAAWGAGAALAADAGTFGVLVVAVAVSRHLQPPPSAQGVTNIVTVREGLRVLRQTPAALAITLLCVAFFGLYGPVEVALPVYVTSVLHDGAGTLGGMWTVYAIGGIVGAMGSAWAQRRGVWPASIVIMIGWGACLIPFGFTASVYVGFAALMLGGLIYGPFVPLKSTLLQQSSAPESLTAILVASGLFTVTAAPVGNALGGPLVAALGPSSTLSASGFATILAALGAAVAWTRIRRAP